MLVCASLQTHNHGFFGVSESDGFPPLLADPSQCRAPYTFLVPQYFERIRYLVLLRI